MFESTNPNKRAMGRKASIFTERAIEKKTSTLDQRARLGEATTRPKRAIDI